VRFGSTAVHGEGEQATRALAPAAFVSSSPAPARTSNLMLSDRPPVDFSTAQTSSKPPLFRLSALLQGHSDDVRCLAGDPYSRLFSSSRDSTARAWVRKGPREGTTGGWAQARVFEGYHTGFVNAVAWLPARLGDNKGACSYLSRSSKSEIRGGAAAYTAHY
jgi:WD40 repeat protein